MYLDYLVDVPEVETPEERLDIGRSSCLKAGAYMVISKTVKDMGLYKKLEETLGAKAAGIILDFASYLIITEGNAAQYYLDYAYNHPLFTPVLEPGGIDHLESDRNSQFELNRNSQCTLTN